MMKLICVVFVAVLSAFCAPACGFCQEVNDSDHIFKTRMLGKIPETTSLEGFFFRRIEFSPKGKRFAYIDTKGKKWPWKCFVKVYGKEHEAFDEVNSLLFSPDGNRLIYGATQGGKSFLVENGKKGKSYDRVAYLSGCFSDDGKRIAYRAKRGGKEFVVVDGEEGPQFDIVYNPHLGWNRGPFLNDGSVVYDAELDKKDYICCGKQIHGPYKRTRSLVIVDKGRTFCYYAVRGDEHFVVMDGKEHKLPAPPAYSDVVFSPDGKRYAYKAYECQGDTSSKKIVFVDGIRQEGTYQYIGSINFSHNSKNFYYMARFEEGQEFIVVNGKAGELFAKVLGLGFNEADELVYSALDEKGQRYIVEGGKKAKWDWGKIEAVIYSPDRKSRIYIVTEVVRRKYKYYAVIGDRKHGPYDYVYEDLFSDDGRRIGLGVLTGREIWWKVFDVPEKSSKKKKEKKKEK